MQSDNTEAAARRSLVAELRASGLRISKSRLALLHSMRTVLPRHFTVQDLRLAVRSQRLKLCLATVYNSLNDFVRVGLLARVSVPTGEVYYDSRRDPHHHVFVEERTELLDIEDSDVEIGEDGAIGLSPNCVQHASGRIELMVAIKKQ